MAYQIEERQNDLATVHSSPSSTSTSTEEIPRYVNTFVDLWDHLRTSPRHSKLPSWFLDPLTSVYAARRACEFKKVQIKFLTTRRALGKVQTNLHGETISHFTPMFIGAANLCFHPEAYNDQSLAYSHSNDSRTDISYDPSRHSITSNFSYRHRGREPAQLRHAIEAYESGRRGVYSPDDCKRLEIAIRRTLPWVFYQTYTNWVYLHEQELEELCQWRVDKANQRAASGIPHWVYQACPPTWIPAQGTYTPGPYSQGLDAQGLYAQVPYGQPIYTQVSYAQGICAYGPYTQGPYTQGPYTQGPYTQGMYAQGTYAQGTHAQRPHAQGPHAQRCHAHRLHPQRPHAQKPHAQGTYT
ncbi:hypothetical protein MMC14_010139 [Varicellaria rhodocarpa]|nr:hypothetical protein [Varicellaria rhodocarpa]